MGGTEQVEKMTGGLLWSVTGLRGEDRNIDLSRKSEQGKGSMDLGHSTHLLAW